jgi:hypothetical protein
LGTRPLPERLRADELFDLGDDVRPAELEFCRDQIFARVAPQRF